jgi:two-component system response regulator HydG
VKSAADGQEAITLVQKNDFDLILLDIKMPNVDGFEVLKYVKDHAPKTKVVMLTGFADLKNAIESKKLGAEDFVSKPYDLVDLLTTSSTTRKALPSFLKPNSKNILNSPSTPHRTEWRR